MNRMETVPNELNLVKNVADFRLIRGKTITTKKRGTFRCHHYHHIIILVDNRRELSADHHHHHNHNHDHDQDNNNNNYNDHNYP